MSEYRFLPPNCWKSKGPDDKTIYIIPGAPGTGTGRFQAIHDLIEDVGAMMSRTPGALSVSTADSLEIMRKNAVDNRKLGPMNDWRELWGKESGKVCILVSCGPSLTESLPEIKGLLEDDEKFFSLGINRAFKAVDLDYFVSLDRRAQPDWIDRDTKHCKLIASTASAPHVAKQFDDRYWGESFLGGIDEGNAPLRSGLCITLTDAMLAAYKLGAEEIWMYGCDFTMSGQAVNDQYLLEKYYFDMPSYIGLGIRPEALREMQPVIGRDEQLGFINYELMAYASYTTAMACMIEESGGVPVRNKSKGGIFYWNSEKTEETDED